VRQQPGLAGAFFFASTAVTRLLLVTRTALPSPVISAAEAGHFPHAILARGLGEKHGLFTGRTGASLAAALSAPLLSDFPTLSGSGLAAPCFAKSISGCPALRPLRTVFASPLTISPRHTNLPLQELQEQPCPVSISNDQITSRLTDGRQVCLVANVATVPIGNRFWKLVGALISISHCPILKINTVLSARCLSGEWRLAIVFPAARRAWTDKPKAGDCRGLPFQRSPRTGS